MSQLTTVKGGTMQCSPESVETQVSISPWRSEDSVGFLPLTDQIMENVRKDNTKHMVLFNSTLGSLSSEGPET